MQDSDGRAGCRWIAVLWIATALACAGVNPKRGVSPSDQSLDAIASDSARLLSRAIQIDTANRPSGEARLAALLVDELTSAGIEAEVIEIPPTPISPTRWAAWARVRGTGEARPVVLLSHLDVVGADGAEWEHAPLAGIVVDGHVIGRGALDAKGVAVVHLRTLVELSRRATPLTRDVILLATPDEEQGGVRGAGYIAEHRRDLLGSAEYLLTEGGSVRVPPRGDPHGPRLWGVTFVEKSPCWLELIARGVPGHSSAPADDAAVPKLIEALDRIRRMETPILVLDEVQRMFAAVAVASDPEDRAHYIDLAAALDTDPVFRARFLANRGYSALVRDTISITTLEGASRTNVAPSVARAHLDVRLLPGGSCTAFRETIDQIVGDLGISTEVLLAFRANHSPADSALFRAIESVASQIDPEAIVVPRLIAGFTDAHWFREIGIISYGFVPRWLTPADTRGIHGPDERISIENLERGPRTLVQILERLSEDGTPVR